MMGRTSSSVPRSNEVILVTPTNRSISERKRVTLYVSRLGDNSDGLSWATAFKTIQAALDAIPDDQGGHRVVIRPDTYMEANLHPAHPGAKGSYNVLDVDWDGSLASGASGYAIIDASDPRKGMHSADYWQVPRSAPGFPGYEWDRWILRHVYATGGDAALFWDLDTRPFSVIVEDCVGIGRAFGGGAGNVLPRPGEPMTWRRCLLWSLDWWGDASGAYVRAENPAPRSDLDFLFEDCTLVGPQCALKSGNPGFATYSRVKVVRCRLVALNFSQPRGTPTDGIIQSVVEGKYLHVDLVDTTMMGYKVFGVREKKETVGDIGYTTKGCVQAYVQFEQDVPKGIRPMGHWPADVFDSIQPPRPAPPANLPIRRPVPSNVERVEDSMCELTPLVWQGRLCHLASVRPVNGEEDRGLYLRFTDAETGEELARFGHGYGLASAVAKDGALYVFASRNSGGTWNHVTLFRSSDLKNWTKKVVIEQEGAEHLFNTSVCEKPGGFVMAYESDDPAYTPFTIKYAVSDDLENWTKVPGAVFGRDRYAACPCIRYAGGYYYQLYLEHRTPRWFFETHIARSKDLKHWEQSSMNPVLTPEGLDEGNNASDPEIVELAGKTYLYYCVGDQLTWMNLKRKRYDEPMERFLAAWFACPPVPEPG